MAFPTNSITMYLLDFFGKRRNEGLFLTLIVISLASTSYDYWQRDIKKNKPRNSLISFSLITNTAKLLSIKNPREKLRSVNGIKAFTIFYIIYLTIFQYNFDGNVKDNTYAWVLAYNDGLLGVFINNAFWAIDSFLFLSGAMMVISFHETNQRIGHYNPIFSIIKQYIRLMTPLMVLVLIRMGISEQLGFGPFYNNFSKILKQPCQDSLVPTILLYQNYIAPYTETCLKNSWYFLVNLQLFIVSQLILILAVRNSKFASKITAILTIIAVAVEFLLRYWQDVGITPAMDRGPLLAQHYYGYAHTRATSWLAGMTLGFMMHEFMKSDLKISKRIKLFGWIATISLFSVSTLSITFFDFESYSQPSAALYVSIHRLVWSLTIGWLVFSSCFEFNGLIDTIFSWEPIQFCGKISLEIYLWSLPVTEYVISMSRDTIYLSAGRVWFHFFPNLVYSMVLAIGMHLLIIMPIEMFLNYCTKKAIFLSMKTKREENEDKNGV